MAFFTLLEFADIKNGFFEYYNEIWNWFDTLLIISWYTFYAIETHYEFEMTPEIKDYTDSIVKMNILKVFIVCVSFLKIVSFCRVFEGFSGLINMLSKVFWEIWNFQVF